MSKQTFKIIVIGILLVMVTPRCDSLLNPFYLSSVSAQGSSNVEYDEILSNSLLLYSPSVQGFDLQSFLDRQAGPLKNYSEELDGQNQSAAEIIDFISFFFGVNPQFTLILLEAQGNLLTDPNAQIPKRLEPKQNMPSFFTYVNWITNHALIAYDGRRYRQADDRVVFPTGDSLEVPIDLNAGTYAAQSTLALILPQDQWRPWVSGSDPIFLRQFSSWFRDPRDDPDQGVAISALPGGYILPFTVNERWYYTGGPHHYCGWSFPNCSNPQPNGRPWSSIDIAPPETISCPWGSFPSDRWIVATQSGTVVVSSQGLIIIDHGDGFRTYYSHVSSADRRGVGNINQGNAIGHPSCEIEPGGSTTGIHVHFAIWKAGEGFIDIAGLLLSGWQVQETSFYNGTMTRNSETRTAKTGRLNGTNDIYNGGIIIIDPFPVIKFWSQPDFQGEIRFEKGKGLYENLDLNAFSLEIPNDLSVETWKANGEYRCWSKSVHKLNDHGWENGISKVKVHEHNACSQVELFSDINNGGRSLFKKGPGFYNEPNHDAQSMKLPSGWSVRTWRGNDRTGEERCWWESQHKLQDHGWAFAIESIEIFDYDDCPHPVHLELMMNVGQQTQVEIVITKVGDIQNWLYQTLRTTNSEGNITGLQLPDSFRPGVYDIYVKPARYLRHVKLNVTLQTGTNTIVFSSSFNKVDLAHEDNMVGVFEILVVLNNWGTSHPDADVDGDGIIGALDLLGILGNWGAGVGWTDNGPSSVTASITDIGTQDISIMSTLPAMANSDFELGANDDWTEVSTNQGGQGSLILNSGSPITARSGSWLARLGFADDETSNLSQTVTMPTEGPIYLHYWYQIDSTEDNCNSDVATVLVNSIQAQQYGLCQSNNTANWTLGTIDMSAYVGQTVTIHFHAETDDSTSSSFFVDDVFFANSPDASGRIILSPDSGVFNVGDSFDMQIRLDTGNYDADGVDLIILYDPGVLEVQDADSNQPDIQINTGSIFGDVRENMADPAIGQIRFSTNGSSFQGNDILATISFNVIAAINNTSVEVLYGAAMTAETNIVEGTTISDVLGQANAASFQTVGLPGRVMPTLSFIPVTNAMLNSSLIELEATATEPHNQVRKVKFEVYLNGVWTTIDTDSYSPNGWRVVWDASPVPDGIYELRATAMLPGGAGTTVTNNNILLDRVPPTYAVSAFTPTSAPSLGVPVTINVIADDEGSDIHQIDVYANSANDGSTNGMWNFLGSVSGSQGSLVWDTSGYSAGIYRIAFEIYDLAGNQGPDPDPILFFEIEESGLGDNEVFLPVLFKN